MTGINIPASFSIYTWQQTTKHKNYYATIQTLLISISTREPVFNRHKINQKLPELIQLFGVSDGCNLHFQPLATDHIVNLNTFLNNLFILSSRSSSKYSLLSSVTVFGAIDWSQGIEIIHHEVIPSLTATIKQRPSKNLCKQNQSADFNSSKNPAFRSLTTPNCPTSASLSLRRTLLVRKS